MHMIRENKLKRKLLLVAMQGRTGKASTRALPESSSCFSPSSAAASNVARAKSI